MPHYPNISTEIYLKMMMDATPNLIAITNGKAMLLANQALLDFVGHPSLESFVEKHTCICNLFEPYNESALLKKMDNLSWLEDVMSNANQHLAYIKKDGCMYSFKVHVGKMIIDNDILYTAVFNDVTELEMQKERYHQAIEGAQIGLWDWNLEDNSIYFSPRWKEMLGFNNDELPNNFASWQDRVHQDDLPLALEAIKANVEGQTPFYSCTHRLRHKDGHWVWIDDKGKTFFDAKGKAVRMVGVHNDITHVKESEAKNHSYALRSQALLQMPLLSETLSEIDFMQQSLEMAEDLTSSAISFIHFVNDGEKTIELVTWSHRTLQKYCHATSYDTHYPVSNAGIWADALREHKVIVVNDYPSFLNKKGLPMGHAPLHRFVSLPVIENGNVVMLCGIGNKAFEYTAEDVETLQFIANEIWRLVQKRRNSIKLKEAQDLLMAQSRNAAMGEMVSMIAHQWRQPISIIGMCVNNMLLDMELDAIEAKEFEKQLHDVLFQVEYLSSTIDDFRNFFKTDKAKELINVADVIEDALNLMQKSFEYHLVFVACSFKSTSKLLLYRHELIQVFLNILQNAKEAFDKENSMESTINITVEENKESVIARICDNAGGIKVEPIEKIFEPYFSTKHEKNGTGLGLYMSKTIIEKHLLGEIKAYNHEDGTCFEIILPKTSISPTIIEEL